MLYYTQDVISMPHRSYFSLSCFLSLVNFFCILVSIPHRSYFSSASKSLQLLYNSFPYRIGLILATTETALIYPQRLISVSIPYRSYFSDSLGWTKILELRFPYRIGLILAEISTRIYGSIALILFPYRIGIILAI
jgi:hypothetical protein